MKRLISILLTMVLLAGVATPALAADWELTEQLESAVSDEVLNKIAVSLADAQELGLTDAADGAYTVGAGLPAYICEDGTYQVSGATYYPLYQDGSLIAMMIERATTPAAQYSANPAMITLLASFETLDGCALLFDSAACYLYNSTTVVKLYDFVDNDAVSDRDTLTMQTAIPNLTTSVQSVPAAVTTAVTMAVQPMTTGSVSLNVPYVGYSSYSKICWAACVASISNYLVGSTYFASDIARMKTPTGNLNVGATLSESCTYLYEATEPYSNVGIFYGAYESAPNNTVIRNQLEQDYPLIGRFKYSGDDFGHQVVICGIYDGTSIWRITAMNPSRYNERETIYWDGSHYSYTNDDGELLELVAYAAHYS